MLMASFYKSSTEPSECYLMCKYSDGCPFKHSAFEFVYDGPYRENRFFCEELLNLYEIFQEIGSAKKKMMEEKDADYRNS